MTVKYSHRNGESKLNKDNELMTIIEYFSNTNITVKINDEIKNNQTYERFKHGTIYSSNHKIHPNIDKIFYNNHGTPMKILNYRRKDDIDVIFLDKNKYISKNKGMNNFVNGEIFNPYDKSVYNIGYRGEIEINKDNKKFYDIWIDMLRRCYSDQKEDKFPSYKDCYVDEEWHCFKNFAEWCYINYPKDKTYKYQLDKDILIKDNKIYSPQTARFIPSRINHLFLYKTDRNLPNGIFEDKKIKGNYIGSYMDENSKNHRISNKNIEKCIQFVKCGKEKTVKKIAEQYREYITEDIYNALINWEYSPS